MTSGRNVMPRRRLPLWILLAITLTGCSSKSKLADAGGGMDMPTVRMALVKIPLDHNNDNNLLDDAEPMERFAPEPVPVAYAPKW